MRTSILTALPMPSPARSFLSSFACHVILLYLMFFNGAFAVLNDDASRAGFADSITWADYWSAQKPGSSGTYSDLYTKMSCCQSLGDDDGSWAGATDCVCRRVVKYRTIQACGLSSACAAAARDIKNAQAKITAFTQKPLTQACSSALQDAICSYHFWGCSGNFPEEVYNNVCLDVCTALETSCSQFGFDVTLSNFTLGKFFHRGCRGYNGSFAQDCTRPSLAVNSVVHAAVTAILLLVLLAG